MKKWHAIAIACVLVLAGCQCFVKSDARRELDGFDPRLVREPQPLFPNIFISDTGKIVLDQTPIRIKKEHVQPNGTVKISWALPAGSKYSFPKGGIQIGPVPTEKFPRKPDNSVSCADSAQPGTGGDAVQQRTAPQLRSSDGAKQRQPAFYGVSPFYVTGVVLGDKYQTGEPKITSCMPRVGTSKVFDCEFVPPPRPFVHKYSVYVCQRKQTI